MSTKGKPSKPAKILENPTVAEVKEEKRVILSNARNLSIYSKFKMECVKRNMSVTSGMAEAIRLWFRHYNVKAD